MAEISFPVSSAPGATPQEGGGRLINAYAERLGDMARGQVARRPAPGLRLFAETEHPKCRGMLEVGGALYVITTDRALRITRNADGEPVVADLGALGGTDWVTMARNNKAPTPDVVVTSELATFLLSPGGVSQLAEEDLPQPNSVTFIFGFLIFSVADGRMFASALNDTAIDALNYATAESRPDGLMRVVTVGRQLYALGPTSIEVWGAPVQAEGFPLSRIETIPRGLIAPFAVAGEQEGWSNALIFVGDDGIVYRLDGYAPTRISTHDLERRIEALADKATLEACVYMHEGHAVWSLSSSDWTWEYDLTTGWWRERASWERRRWRASKTAKAFGAWIAGDAEEGALYEVRADERREWNDPLAMEIWSAPGSAFPGRINVPAAQFDFVVGEGLASGQAPDQTEPKVAISWSDDGGRSWSNPLTRPLGGQGEYHRTVSVHRTGMAGPKGRIWRLTLSDAVPAALMGGTMDVSPRKA
jgi:hypothetical protein